MAIVKEITATGVVLNALGTANIEIDGLVGQLLIGLARKTLTPTSTPKVTRCMFYEQVALTAGAYTLDLCAGPDGVTLDTLYLRAWAFWVPDGVTNSSLIRFDKGASNGINFGGSANDDISLLPGGLLWSYLGAGGPQVLTASAKTIDLTSSDATAKFGLFILAGTA